MMKLASIGLTAVAGLWAAVWRLPPVVGLVLFLLGGVSGGLYVMAEQRKAEQCDGKTTAFGQAIPRQKK